MRDNRFVMDDSDIYFPSEDIMCKRCKFRSKDTPDAYTFCDCKKYPDKQSDHSDMKPTSIIFKGKPCKFYEEES